MNNKYLEALSIYFPGVGAFARGPEYEDIDWKGGTPVPKADLEVRFTELDAKPVNDKADGKADIKTILKINTDQEVDDLLKAIKKAL